MELAAHREAGRAEARPEVFDLIEELLALRRSMLEMEGRLVGRLTAVDANSRPSGRNFVHYLALRRHDMRPLQDKLARIGLSSLGRAESHVLANLDQVLALLHALAGRRWSNTDAERDEPCGIRSGRALLEQHGEALFGVAPPTRRVRLMVTLASEAARDPVLVGSLVHAGMDIARINCAHDGPAEWTAMASHVRRTAGACGRSVRILMDLGGPKIRPGAVAPGPSVVKLKPERDEIGLVTAPVRVGLRPTGSDALVPSAQFHLGVDPVWLAQLGPGDRIDVDDARGSSRRWTVIDLRGGGALVEVDRTTYVTEQTKPRLHRREAAVEATALHDLPRPEGHLHLRRGETLRLKSEGLGMPESHGAPGRRVEPASIACTLPEVLNQVKRGERVWFDDGRIGGVVRRVSARGVDVEITDAPDDGASLGADKGINLPDSSLNLPALTERDLRDLEVAARHADIVGLSFAQSADDVRALRDHLARLGASELGIILKIETRRGFERLPEMLFAAMDGPPAGVMIARGDLAVECGFERLAEIQEELLWACEAAHMPVVWATQVLETLAKTGRPSRAEITDAAMGERAECVMLNKGAHILDAIRTLDDILRRMQEHQSKKRPLMRALKAWAPID